MLNLRKLRLLVPLIIALGAAGCGDDDASDSQNVGAACSADGGCTQALTCATTVAGGYCTKTCTMTGSTSECPGGSVCDTVSGAGITCVQICKDTAECRSGLDCNGVSGSNLKACKPR